MNVKLESTYLYFLALLYFSASLIGILHHELWLDEAHHWLLARDSNSVSELYKNTRSEGHPLLWSGMLYGITRLTSNPFWMQFLHIAISTSFVLIFLKKAPFPWIFKTLFIFGYFILFEYNVISRNYSLGILFLFLACSLFKERNHRFSLLCVCLALVSNTHMMFAVVSFALFLTLLYEQFQNRQLFKAPFVLGYFFFGFGLLLFLFQMQTTNSEWLLTSHQTIPIHERLIKGFISFFKGILTVPDFRTIHFWNSNLFINVNKPACLVLGLLIYLLPFFLFLKNRKTLFFVYIALLGLQVFFFITQRGATRFDGSCYIIIIIGLWIENYYPLENYKFKYSLNPIRLNFFRKGIIYTILIIHFCSGVYSYSMDNIFPFSSSKDTVDFLKKNRLDKENIITITCDGTSISPYLGRKIFFLCDENFKSYCNWDFNCAQNITQNKIKTLIINYMKTHDKAVYVSNYNFIDQKKAIDWTPIDAKVKVRFLKKIHGSILRNTSYYVFEVVKTNSEL